MENILIVLMLAITVEAVTEWAKLLVSGGKVNVWMVVSFFVAETLAVSAGVDLYAQMGVSFMMPYIGSILTGIFLSRGSNYVFDLFNRLRNPRPIDTGKSE